MERKVYVRIRPGVTPLALLALQCSGLIPHNCGAGGTRLRTFVLLTLSSVSVMAGYLGPTPYLSFADSPFSGLSFGYFHLETFETGSPERAGLDFSELGCRSQPRSVDRFRR